jgi:plasmid stability protein
MTTVISSLAVKQTPQRRSLLLRLPDDVHRRLVARAAREGRSVNAVATEILDAAADADEGDRRSRLRARASALGILRAASPARPVSRADRERIIATMKGVGPIADRLIAEEREVP